MTDIAISVRNVSKCYRVFEDQRSRLLHAVWPSRQSGMQEIWALKDINFEVRRGDSFGVIGRNGCGKSTLLEIITQTLTPTMGSVEVHGRIAALLELGSGFNPEYTGRENVFLNGLLLGLSRTEVQDRFDDIAAFADIGGVLDRPVKTYSSGMLVRLAFAVQVALQPDILIVDEALSVGDYFFQQKCFGRLRQMREDGLTLLFVSHDMGTVRDLCKQAIYLRHGTPQFIGDSGTAIQKYFNEPSETGTQATNTLAPAHLATESVLAPAPAPGPEPGPTVTGNPNAIWSRKPSDTDRLLDVSIVNENGQDIDHARIGTRIQIKARYRTLPTDITPTVNLAIKNRYDQIIFATTAEKLGIESCHTHGAHSAVMTFVIDLTLEAGLYSLRVNISQPTGHNKGLQLDSTDWFGPFRCDWDYESEPAPFLGMFGLPATGTLLTV